MEKMNKKHKALYNLGKFVTINEIMSLQGKILHNRPICQYIGSCNSVVTNKTKRPRKYLAIMVWFV
jgi:hypothetical protein